MVLLTINVTGFIGLIEFGGEVRGDIWITYYKNELSCLYIEKWKILVQIQILIQRLLAQRFEELYITDMLYNLYEI